MRPVLTFDSVQIYSVRTCSEATRVKVKRDQLKLDLMATGAPLAVATRLEHGADGFGGGMIVDAIVAVAGILIYIDADGNETRELRSPEELQKLRSLATLNGRPTTNTHPPMLIDSSDASQYARGSAIEVGRWLESHEQVRANLIMTDAKLIEDFENGRRAISPGLLSDDVFEPGVWRGQKYDLRQTNLRYNHVAFVDKGRANEARARMDSAPDDMDDTMATTRKIRFNGLDIEVPADAYEAMQAKLDASIEVDTLRTQITSLKAKLDMDPDEEVMDMEPSGDMAEVLALLKQIVGEKEDMDPEVDEELEVESDMAAKQDAAVSERLGLIVVLKSVKPDVGDEATKMDADTLRRAIITHRAPTMKEKVDGLSGAALSGMYEGVMAVPVAAPDTFNDAARSIVRQSTGAKQDAADDSNPLAAAYKKSVNSFNRN